MGIFSQLFRSNWMSQGEKAASRYMQIHADTCRYMKIHADTCRYMQIQDVEVQDDQQR